MRPMPKMLKRKPIRTRTNEHRSAGLVCASGVKQLTTAACA
jgi:hypothetical protein